jgi:hypothetical protein
MRLLVSCVCMHMLSCGAWAQSPELTFEAAQDAEGAIGQILEGGKLVAAIVCEKSADRTLHNHLSVRIRIADSQSPKSATVASMELKIDQATFVPAAYQIKTYTDHSDLVGDIDKDRSAIVRALRTALLVEITGAGRTDKIDLGKNAQQVQDMGNFADACNSIMPPTPTEVRTPDVPEAGAAPSLGDPNIGVAEYYNQLNAEGDALYNGSPTKPRDYAAAFAKYLEAANGGSVSAMSSLGFMYDTGQGTKADAAEALAWYTKAADGGDSQAMDNIGTLYDRGRGVRRDANKAFMWYLKAANAGNVVGMTEVGDSYFFPRGVSQDFDEAAFWYKKAADLGSTKGQWLLSVIICKGLGHVQADAGVSSSLAYRALTHGNETARQNLERNFSDYPGFVKGLQSLMQRDGFYSGPIDGTFNQKTLDAIDAAFGSAPKRNG